MRVLCPILLILALPVSASAGEPTTTSPPALCASSAAGPSACDVSKKDLKEAQSAFSRALKLQRAKRLDEAYEEFQTAARLVPRDVEFLTARELVRQQLIHDHLQRGNAALISGKQIEALAEFRSALHLDPENAFARQRLNDALGEPAPPLPGPPRVLADAGQIQVAPNAERADFHFRGDSRELLVQVAKVFGISSILDDSVLSRQVRFDIQGVDFYTAMQAACDVTKTFWTPMDAKQILLAADTAENHRQFDRMTARTFYIPGATSPQDLNDAVNALRTLFEIRFINQQPNKGTITVRAPQRMLDAATEFIENLDASRPQVLLDINLYEVSRTLTRDMGLQIPNQFTIINIPSGALAALSSLGGQNIQDLINQLIAGGGINQANSTAISALLAQLQNQQNSIFSQPLATFGNGKTLFGVSLGTLGATLSINESSVRNLEHATLHAAQGNETSFRVGERYPIMNATFAPIFNSAAIAQVIGNNSFVAAIPSFTYEDLGLTLKAKPQVHDNTDVTLTLEMELRSLGSQTVNGVPIINNREYKGMITLKNDEPGVVTGSVSRSEQLSMNGIPGLGAVPGLNKIMTSNSKQEDEDELMVVITPHILTGAYNQSSEIWLTPAR